MKKHVIQPEYTGLKRPDGSAATAEDIIADAERIRNGENPLHIKIGLHTTKFQEILDERKTERKVNLSKEGCKCFAA